jgi:hypothetical protein
MALFHAYGDTHFANMQQYPRMDRDHLHVRQHIYRKRTERSKGLPWSSHTGRSTGRQTPNRLLPWRVPRPAEAVLKRELIRQPEDETDVGLSLMFLSKTDWARIANAKNIQSASAPLLSSTASILSMPHSSVFVKFDLRRILKCQFANFAASAKLCFSAG